ncbi:Mu transposase C-terminal domain-containing protein [Kibdelosporangium philippinense]|uniref:Mu transposase C-terminal domain-containing protein n=1 Tax=Kibdelosporangium philippinense TaxID=211113 RepID=A0ABS8ZR42_9PSEU|nr:Mu transposase C-terminal domain-containing protein [Kibdelosporangium philippinense]MCE7010072.1 Mu transposase C-terminal domain-containing protein [Kibdelosporangium philippinense]
MERFFKSLREGLIQHLPAYKGPDLHSRGLRVEEQAFLFLHELEDVIRDWIVSVYHPTDHAGLAVADWPNLAVSPNEMFAAGIAKAGLLRIPATPELVFEFLRVAWRTIQHYGVEVDGRRYNGPALDGYRNAPSPHCGVAAGKWPIRVNDDDVRFVYFQDPDDSRWHRLDWEHSPMLGTPFSAEAARYARTLATRTDRLADPNVALAQVLERWSSGAVTDRRERRMAARLSAERAAIPGLADPRLDGIAAPPQHEHDSAPPDAQPHLVAVTGDDDEETDLVADMNGFYDDALEVLE